MEPATAYVLSGALGAGANLLGGLFARKGQKEANLMNYRIAKEQMAFQERMSNTAYQRASQDLQKAGLNRILALGKPATSPAGASAVMQNPNAIAAEKFSQAAHSALSVMRAKQEIKNLQAQEGLIRAQTESEAERPEQIRQDTSLSRARTLLNDELTLVEKQRWQKIYWETQSAQLSTEKQRMLMAIYQANPKLLLAKEIPWQGLSAAAGVLLGAVGLGAVAKTGAQLARAYKAFRAKGGKMPYNEFRRLIQQIEDF